jgi:hypothetical protein
MLPYSDTAAVHGSLPYASLAAHPENPIVSIPLLSFPLLFHGVAAVCSRFSRVSSGG